MLSRDMRKLTSFPRDARWPQSRPAKTTSLPPWRPADEALSRPGHRGRRRPRLFVSAWRTMPSEVLAAEVPVAAQRLASEHMHSLRENDANRICTRKGLHNRRAYSILAASDDTIPVS